MQITIDTQENKNVVCWGGITISDSPPSQKFLQVSAGWGHSCGILTNNEIKCWGALKGLTHFKRRNIQVSASVNYVPLTKKIKRSAGVIY